MLERHIAACLVATALAGAPALAQVSTGPAGNTPVVGGNAAASRTNIAAADFVKQAANSDMFEIQSSQMALNRTQDKEVRDFAQRMVRDHTQSSEKLKAAAKGETVPTSLDQEHAQMLQRLQQASGSDFTQNYIQMQVAGHQQAVSLFENYAQNGDNADLKQFAQQTLPTLREHQHMISQITVASTGNKPAGQRAAQNFITEERPGMWQASKLMKLNVYNEANEKVGSINDVLLDRDGKVEAVVIGVGGFLGIGEHNVAVPYSALQWSMNAPAVSTASTAGPNSAATPAGALGNPAVPPGPAPTAGAGNTRPVSATPDNNPTRNYPDHAVLPNASKDQLKNAPQFRYSNAR